MINSQRLADSFTELVQIDSVSRHEGAISKRLQEILACLGAKIVIDDAGPKAGSDTGNLIAYLPGTKAAEPLLLCAHMDTVQPGEGVKWSFSDGTFRSDGATILGADDKSAIAVILESIRALQENSIPYGPLEIVLTICEEVGLTGAKYLDYSLLKSRYGYCLDSTTTDGLIVRAPTANRMELTIHGRAAHAGAAPEKGINAIQVASKAISKIPLGRVDFETTANIGVIQGGTATNIVPELVTMLGEVRSHNKEKLESLTQQIVKAFEHEVASYKHATPSDDGLPKLDAVVRADYPQLNVTVDHPVISLAKKASAQLGRSIILETSGGGSDANIFFGKGIVTAILGTGMKDMHTTQESIRLEDMVRAAELLLQIIKIHG